MGPGVPVARPGEEGREGRSVRGGGGRIGRNRWETANPSARSVTILSTLDDSRKEGDGRVSAEANSQSVG